MKFILIVIIILLSCSNSSHQQENTTAEVPKSLEQEGKSSGSYKRSPGDLVQSLYNELSEGSPELQQLNREISELGENETDSIKSFSEFQRKNNSYYHSAGGHNKLIRDSVLKQKMELLINRSQSKYLSQTAQHQALLNGIAAKNLTIADLHVVLKIVTTIPVIEKFQESHLPSHHSLQNFSKDQDNKINKLSTIVKKNGG